MMDDIKTLAKELHRIADAGERIAKALEKQNKVISISPQVCINPDSDTEKIKEWVRMAMENAVNEVKERT